MWYMYACSFHQAVLNYNIHDVTEQLKSVNKLLNGGSSYSYYERQVYDAWKKIIVEIINVPITYY